MVSLKHTHTQTKEEEVLSLGGAWEGLEGRSDVNIFINASLIKVKTKQNKTRLNPRQLTVLGNKLLKPPLFPRHWLLTLLRAVLVCTVKATEPAQSQACLFLHDGSA